MFRIVVILLFITIISLPPSSGRVVCYFTSWSIYRPGNGQFNTSNVDPSLCTHIIYANVGLNSDGAILIIDQNEAVVLGEIANLISLKNDNPDLKILFSMGGFNVDPVTFSQVAADDVKRTTLVESVLTFADQFGFDGFDLNWEYPAEEDKLNFVILLIELHQVLGENEKILSVGVSGGVAASEVSYSIRAVSDNVDLINFKSYGYHGVFENYVGHHAPLYESYLDQTMEQRERNIIAGVGYWLDLGADRKKLNLGIATFGAGFTLVDPENTELYAPIAGPSNPGLYTNQTGILGYNEICELYSDWDMVFDSEQRVSHLVHEDQWVGYDDYWSIGEKIEWAKSVSLGGVMLFSLDTDDFLGLCGEETYPLLRQINAVLYK